MLVPSSAPLPTNSQTPISAARIARGRAALARFDSAEKLARFAVLGYCNKPLSYANLGIDVMADVARNPMTPVPNAGSSAGVLQNGSGILDSSPNMSAPPVSVLPMDGSGLAVPNDPEYGPLTVQYTRPSSGKTCAFDRVQIPVTAASGDYAAAWGDAFALPAALPSVASGSGVVAWLKANPVVSVVALLAIGAVAVKGGKR